MDLLVHLQQISKIYPRVHKPRERLQAFIALLFGRKPRQGVEVLRDINLEVVRGQSLGIIGENGAGKSTLLKVLTGVIQPTQGQVKTRGTIAAMLELSAGFQPDFTGLDNVRMKASLMGLSSAELDEMLDDILAFADIGDYIYEPVKHYSSGMVVRLGFAVITACRPDLLITDEVLSVGAESFQKKCIRWIEQFLQDGGTLLLVSHSMYVVQKLCQKVIWIHDGAVRQSGDVFSVTQAYLAWHEHLRVEEREVRLHRQGDGSFYRIEQFRLLPERNPGKTGMVAEFAMGEDIVAELVIYSPDDRPPVGVIGIVRADGTPVYGIDSDQDKVTPERINDQHYLYSICFDNIDLLPGSYSLRGFSMDPEGIRLFDSHEVAFKVTGKSREMGFVRLPHRWG